MQNFKKHLILHTLSAFLVKIQFCQQIIINTKLPLQFWHDSIKNFDKIMNHGCWCSSFLNMKNSEDLTLPHVSPIDELDQICKNVIQCQKCVQQTEKACQYFEAKIDSNTWVQKYSRIENGTDSRPKTKHISYKCLSEDDCVSGFCRCSVQLAVEVSAFFNLNKNEVNFLKKSNFECKKFNKTEKVLIQEAFEDFNENGEVQDLVKLESNFYRSGYDHESIGFLYDKYFKVKSRNFKVGGSKCCGHSPHFEMVKHDQNCKIN